MNRMGTRVEGMKKLNQTMEVKQKMVILRRKMENQVLSLSQRRVTMDPVDKESLRRILMRNNQIQMIQKRTAKTTKKQMTQMILKMEKTVTERKRRMRS